MNFKSNILNKLKKPLLLGVSLIGLTFAGLALYIESQLPSVGTLKDIRLQVPMRIYAANGDLIAEYGEKRRIPIQYEAVPPLLIHAILATEDQRFFEHPGVDIFGLGRAAIQLVRTGTKSQGGSTITMQVARNFFLSRKKTFLRKFNEILLAIKIDYRLPKEKILELYLNKIYLGHRAYGVAAAAQVYYGKSLDELSLAEIATIAGLPKAPSALNPLSNVSASVKRRNHVLSRLFNEGYINKADYTSAINAPQTAAYHGPKVVLHAPFVAEVIRKTMLDNFGQRAYTQGYQIHTTIDSRLQRRAQKAVVKGLLAYDKRHGYRGALMHLDLQTPQEPQSIREILETIPTINALVPALVTAAQAHQITVSVTNGTEHIIDWAGLQWARRAHTGPNGSYMGLKPKLASDIVKVGDVIRIHKVGKQWQLAQLPEIEGALIALTPEDGAIVAMSGGFDFNKSHYNRAVQAKRQPGSSFKPFIYAAALAKGMTLASIINDAPVVLDDPSLEGLWRPQNANRRFDGPTRLRTGLIHSRNLVSIRLLDLIGVDYTLEFLTQLGFTLHELPRSLSLALGTNAITPLELTGHFGMLANGGYKIEPYLITRIVDINNDTVLEAKPTRERVLSPEVAYLMNLVLRDVVARGTGRGARVLGRRDIAGKTGTTNDQIDNWFAGFHKTIATSVWVGFDKPHSTHEYAVRSALPIWVDFMKSALANIPHHSLQRPSGLVTVRIDPKTGLQATDTQKQTVFETFRKAHVPPKAQSENHSVTDETQSVDELF